MVQKSTPATFCIPENLSHIATMTEGILVNKPVQKQWSMATPNCSSEITLMSLVAYQFGHVEFRIFFFQLHLPLENNSKYSKFEVQSSTLPNRYLYKITSFPSKVAAYMRVLPTSWSQLVFDASTFIRTSWSLTFLEQDSHQQNQVHRHMQLQLGQRFFLL